MSLADVWRELEDQLQPGQAGRLVRRIHETSAADLYVTVHAGPAGRHRRLELEVPVGICPTDCAVQTTSRQVTGLVEPADGGRERLVLSLEDRAVIDIFADMAGNIADAAAAAPGSDAAVAAWIGRFRQWRRMLEHGPSGLGAEAQRGLYAELLVMRDELTPTVGADEAISGWVGPTGAPRDFDLGGTAVEVKSSIARQPHVVRINGERQLDDAGLDRLFLIHLAIEPLRYGPNTLPAMVEDVTTLAAGRPYSGLLEDRLVEAGYHATHAAAYEGVGYLVRATRSFRVAAGFPRIIDADLPTGVGAVSYDLAIDACEAFEIPMGELWKELRAV